MALFTRLVTTALFLLCSALSYAIDIIPGRAVPPPPDINAFMATMSHSHLGESFVNGDDQNLDGGLDSYYLQLRYSRSFLFNDNPAAFYVQPSLGTIKPSGSLNDRSSPSGLGDTAFVIAYWPYSDWHANSHLVFVGYLVAPTGEHDSDQLLNLSQNRYSSAMQLAYQHNLKGKWDGMIALDTQWFGKNNDYRLTGEEQKQSLLYSSQFSLMYRLSKQFLLSSSYYFQHGAETRLDGAQQDDEIHKHRYQFALTSRFPFGNIIFQLGGDLETRNGFKEDHRVIVRYGYSWKD